MRKTLALAAGWTGGCSPMATSIDSSTNEVRSTQTCRSRIFERAATSRKEQRPPATLLIFPPASAKGCQNATAFRVVPYYCNRLCAGGRVLISGSHLNLVHTPSGVPLTMASTRLQKYEPYNASRSRSRQRGAVPIALKDWSRSPRPPCSLEFASMRRCKPGAHVLLQFEMREQHR